MIGDDQAEPDHQHAGRDDEQPHLHAPNGRVGASRATVGRRMARAAPPAARVAEHPSLAEAVDAGRSPWRQRRDRTEQLAAAVVGRRDDQSDRQPDPVQEQHGDRGAATARATRHAATVEERGRSVGMQPLAAERKQHGDTDVESDHEP